MATPSVLCKECETELYNFSDLVILTSANDVVVARKINRRIYKRDCVGDDVGYCVKTMFCRSCSAKVGKCLAEGISQTLTDRLSAKRILLRIPGGEVSNVSKWVDTLPLLEEFGMERVGLADICEEVHGRSHSRVKEPIYGTVLVDVKNTPTLTLEELTITKPRDYQLEMIEHSLRRNSLVCLPTGSGKTLISAGVIAAMLHINPRKVAAFVVKTNTLVEQQSLLLAKEIPRMKIVAVSGQMDLDKKRENLKAIGKFDYDVVVSTCALLDVLIEMNHIRIEDLCCLVLDEAHHAKKSDPYAKLMDRVYDKKISAMNQPLVLGLTASPVDEKPKTSSMEIGLRCKIRELSETLGCLPSYPLLHNPYEKWISQPTDAATIKTVEKDEDKFRRQLDKYLFEVVDVSKELISPVSKKFEELETFIDRQTSTLDTNKFRGKLRDIEKELDKNRDEATTEDQKFLIQSGYAVRDHLNQILAVHEINNVIGHELAMNRMLEVFEEIKDPSPGQERVKKKVLSGGRDDDQAIYSSFYRELKAVKKNRDFAKHNLSIVCKEILKITDKHYTENRTEARVLIFVDMRRTAKKLCKCLQQIKDMRLRFNPHVIVGRGLQGDGLTIEEQKEILNDFRKGSTRLLVTTTILEEGLDVPDCNMVIRLSAPQNLREFIQSRGRACRSKHGKFNVFCKDRAERALQDSFRECVEQQPIIVKSYMEECLAEKTEDKPGLERKILDLNEDTGRIKGSVSASKESEENIEDENIQELIKLMTEIDMTPDQERDTKFLDEFVPGEVSLPMQFAWWPQRDETYKEEIEDFKTLLANDHEIELFDWNDLRRNLDHLLLGTKYYPEVKIISTNAKGVEEMSLFEKKLLNNCFMTDRFDGCCGNFWISMKSPVVYFPKSTGLRLALSQVHIGSLVSPKEFVRRLTIGQTARLSIDRASDNILITINDSFRIEGNFGDLQSFVLVDQMGTEQADEDPIVRIHLTFAQPPRLSVMSTPTIADATQDTSRACSYNDDKTRRIFAKCLTYQLEVPNLLSETKNCPFESRIRQVLRLLESCGKTVYFAHIRVMEPALDQLPTEEEGLDPHLCQHHACKDVNYAMKCLESSKGFVFDRVRQDFFRELNSIPEELATKALYKLTGILNKTMFCDYTAELKKIVKKIGRHADQDFSSSTKNYKYIKRAIITPTQILFFEPDFIQTNRTVRRNGADKFLRVSIRDEDCENLTSLHGKLEAIMNRVGEILQNGIKISDMEYKYLASSSSQLRGHSCYFIEDLDAKQANQIRKEQGDLTEIRNVGKYVARMGLGFSTSHQTISVGRCEREDDIVKNGYTYSDGIGFMAQSVAKKVKEKLKLDETPSAYQIRLGGCKGMLCVWNDDFLRSRGNTARVCVRDSMYKFPSGYETLEVLDWTRPLPLHLNHQVIMLLNNVGVPDDIFLELLRKDITRMAKMFVDEASAKEELKTVVKKQVEDLGKVRFRFTTDVYFRQLMMSIYRTKMKDLRERSRVQLDTANARVLIGVLDETGVLEYGQVFIQVSKFLERPKVQPQVIASTIVIMKNPCIHPGDVRTFQGVDVPELRHLVDCVVFPQNGPRPHPNELSGSDLDGDQYHCIWDPKLLPSRDLRDPMDYTNEYKADEIEDIGVEEMIDYTCKYIENDNLGIIDNTHKALADQLGLESDECLELAVIHSKAVDAPKTGDWQTVPKDLKEKLHKYPDFMMKYDKPSYLSSNVLGEMFRECNKYIGDCEAPLDDGVQCPMISADHAFKAEGYENYTDEARVDYKNYSEELLSVMRMYGIQSEAELISGHLVNVHSRLKKEIDDVGINARKLVSEIMKKYREMFERDLTSAGEDTEAKQLEKASAWYSVAYESRSQIDRDPNEIRILSFPWLVSDILAKIYLNNTTKESIPFVSPELAISKSIEDVYFDMVELLARNYEQHDRLARELGKLSYPFSQSLLTGTSSTFLFDHQYGEVSMLLLKKKCNPRSHQDNVESRLRLLKKFQYELANELQESFLDDGRLHLRLKMKNKQLIKKRADVTSDDWSLYIWTIIKTYIFENKWLHPVLYLLCSWVRQVGLIGGKIIFVPDYFVPLLFIDHCLQSKEIKEINIQQAFASYQSFLGNSNASYPLGTFQDWKHLMESLKQSCQMSRPCAWEPNPGKCGKILRTFFESAKTLFSSSMHESLRHALGCENWKEAAEEEKVELLEIEMEKASHRLALHVNAAALLSKMNVERLFYLRLPAAQNLAGDEDALAKSLHIQCGAWVDIQTKMGAKDPGMIVKGNGTEAELYILSKKIKLLNKKAETEAKMSRRVRVRGMKDMPGAHNLIIEGTREDKCYIKLDPYFGYKYPQHDYKTLYVVRLFGSSASVNTSHAIDSPAADDFRTHMKHQLSAFHRNYSKEIYGNCELQIKFGRSYVVSPPRSFVEDPSGLTAKDLLKALENRRTRDVDPTWDVARFRPRSSQYGAKNTEGTISSSFFSSIVWEDEARTKLLSMTKIRKPTAIDSGVKMVVEQASGSLTARYDAKLNFIGIETSPFRWVVSDIKRTCHAHADKAEGDECDIRFLMKTQMQETTNLIEHAQTKGLTGALQYDSDGSLCVTNEELDVHFLEKYESATYQMQPTSLGVQYNLMIRNATQYTRRLGAANGTTTFASKLKLCEVRLLPDVQSLLNSETLNDTLDSLWELAFQCSNYFRSRTQ